jgi:4-amino-4-deoxy-L-arabinose transferase-like glycosyltransferase
MLLILSFTLSLLTALLATSLVKFQHWMDWLIAIYLMLFSETVLVFEILGLISSVNNILLFFIIQLLLGSVFAILWRKSGNPPLLSNLNAIRKDLLVLWQNRKYHTLLFIFTGIIVFLWIFNAGLVITVPPNTSDSLSTHLARVIHWIQNGSFQPWDTRIIWQVVYPFNAQLQFLYTILFTSSDRLVGFAQYTAGLICFLAIYRLGLFFKWQKSRALFAALIWATFPGIILQSTSTQNDLVLAALFASCILFLFIGMKELSYPYLVISGLSLGIAIGTKQTILFLVPGLGLSILFLLLKFKRVIIKPLLVWGVTSFASFLILGSYIYLQNSIYFNSPAGPAEKVEGQTNEFSLQAITSELPVNLSRLAYQFIDPTGLPGEFPGYLQKFKAKMVEYAGLKPWMESDIGALKIFELRDIPPTHEDSAWFGLIGFLLLVPAGLFQIIEGIKKKDPFRLGIIALVLGFYIFIALLRPGWSPYVGRYFAPVATLSAPLIAGLNLYTNFGRKIRWTLAFISVMIAVTIILNNESKPLIGDQAIWEKDRISLQLITSPDRSSEILKFADEYLPEGSTFGVRKLPLFYEYVLLDDNSDRTIIWVPDNSTVFDKTWLEQENISYLLLDDNDFPPQSVPRWAIPYESRKDWTIYVIR